MTTNDRVREQSFSYDDSVPLSVPEGDSLRERRPPHARAVPAQARLPKRCRAALTALARIAGRAGG